MLQAQKDRDTFKFNTMKWFYNEIKYPQQEKSRTEKSPRNSTIPEHSIDRLGTTDVGGSKK